MNYDTAKLRQFINDYFGSQELNDLLFDYFRSVYEDLTPGMTKRQHISVLLEFCRKHNKMQELLAAIQQERPFFQSSDYIQNEDISHMDNTHVEDVIGEDAEANSWIVPKTGTEMMRIPASDFLYGNDRKKIYLDEFWIAKTAVTNAEYAKFIAEGNAVPPRHWKAQMPPPEIFHHPVVFVTWHDAKAYAVWADMELPTEQQWEKAGRGTDGRNYPWGNEWLDKHCNTRESGIRKTTPVNQFSPQGNSPFRCCDMSGNVWEWTESLFQEGMDLRVMRGGSWGFNRSLALMAYRNREMPNSCEPDIGFRLATHRVLP